MLALRPLGGRSKGGGDWARDSVVLQKWLADGLALPGKSQKGLAAHLGVSHPVVSRMLSGKRRIQVDEIHKISEYLGVQPPPITPSPRQTVLTPMGAVRTVPVRFALALGVWRAPGSTVMNATDIPVVPDARLANLEQYACRLDGQEFGSEQGSFVVCVGYDAFRLSPGDDDLVHVRRQLAQTELEEHSLGRVRVANQVVTITAEGQNAPRTTWPLADVDIVGLVVGRYYHVKF